MIKRSKLFPDQRREGKRREEKRKIIKRVISSCGFLFYSAQKDDSFLPSSSTPLAEWIRQQRKEKKKEKQKRKKKKKGKSQA